MIDTFLNARRTLFVGQLLHMSFQKKLGPKQVIFFIGQIQPFQYFGATSLVVPLFASGGN